MLNKRPHILSFASLPESVQDEDGNWQKPDPSGTNFLPCRAEPNGSGREVASQDGNSYVYSWLIYLDLIPDTITSGTEVKIYDNGTEIGTGTVKLFYKGSKNCRIWL